MVRFKDSIHEFDALYKFNDQVHWHNSRVASQAQPIQALGSESLHRQNKSKLWIPNHVWLQIASSISQWLHRHTQDSSYGIRFAAQTPHIGSSMPSACQNRFTSLTNSISGIKFVARAKHMQSNMDLAYPNRCTGSTGPSYGIRIAARAHQIQPGSNPPYA